MSNRTLHAFPARMAPEIALQYLPRQQAGQGAKSVLDPMCGSGTVLRAAVAEGHRALGFDVDPLAVRMSLLATTKIDTGELAYHAERVLAQATYSESFEMPWSATDLETDAFATYWFATTQRVQLGRLAASIGALPGGVIRVALEVALSRLIVTKNPAASLAADTAHSRPHRVLTDSEYQIYEGFSRSVGQIIRQLDQRDLNGSSTVNLGDARNLNLSAQSVDLVVTSPPYLNAIDYLRGHRMSLIWFGYSIAELRSIRAGSIGAERNIDKGKQNSFVEETSAWLASDVSAPDKLPIKQIERYMRDMFEFACEARRVLRWSSLAVLVVGNSTVRGNYIKTDEIIARALTAAGFSAGTRSVREIPESRRYMPLRSADPTSSLAMRMRHEVVLTATSPSNSS